VNEEERISNILEQIVIDMTTVLLDLPTGKNGMMLILNNTLMQEIS
jgi:hypothetical protein